MMNSEQQDDGQRATMRTDSEQRRRQTKITTTHKKLGLDRVNLSRDYTAERSGLIRPDHVTRRISADLFVCSQERPVPARVPAPG